MSTLTLRPRGGGRAYRPAAQAPQRSYPTGRRQPRSPHPRPAALDGKLPLTTTLITLTGRLVPCICWPKSTRPHFDS